MEWGFKIMKGHTLWFTGLSGSGKTTIANDLVKKLREKNIPVVLLDGDVVRKTLSHDLGYTKEERDTHITRVADVSHLISSNDVLVVACVLSPTRSIRRYARNLIKDFIEIYVKCPLSVCEERDVKGYYKKVRAGAIKEFVGISIPYEEPESPEIIVETDKGSVEESVHKILTYLEDKDVVSADQHG